jgi:hypothetical protein
LHTDNSRIAQRQYRRHTQSHCNHVQKANTTQIASKHVHGTASNSHTNKHVHTSKESTKDNTIDTQTQYRGTYNDNAITHRTHTNRDTNTATAT